jgi:hypothetical protein
MSTQSDGDDGAPITDYDIIGSQQRGTAVALRGTDFVISCVPPLTRERDIGPSAVVAMRLYGCALLIVDPPSEGAIPRRRCAVCEPRCRPRMR